MKYPIKRTVYFSLLIVCLAAGFTVLFLPYASLNNCYFYRDEQLFSLDSIPLSSFSYLYPGLVGLYLRGGYTNYDFVVLLTAFFGALAGLFLLLSIRRVLEALKWDDYHSQQLSLGAGPTAGLILCGLLIIISLFLAPYQERIELPDPSLIPTAWPFLGALFHLCAMRLARALNSELPSQKENPAD